MPIGINGSGSITGINPGGLPDDCITTAEIAANAVTAAELGTAEQSGLCKAWVNFNGTGTVAIRASFNVSSITDNGTGDYTVNFTTALTDANYCVCGTSNAEDYSATGASFAGIYAGSATTRTTTAFRFGTSRMQSSSGAAVIGPIAQDQSQINVVIFR